MHELIGCHGCPWHFGRALTRQHVGYSVDVAGSIRDSSGRFFLGLS